MLLRCLKTGQISSSRLRHLLYLDPWSIGRLEKCAVLSAHDGCVNCLSWNETGSLLLSGSDDATIAVWEYPKLNLKAKVQTYHTANIFCGRFLPSKNQWIVSCAGDSLVRVTDYTTKQVVKVFASHRDRVKKISVELDNPNTFLSCSEDNTVRLFDLRADHPSPSSRVTADPNVIARFDSRFDEVRDTLRAVRSTVVSISSSEHRPHYFAMGGQHPSVWLMDRRMLTPRSMRSFVSRPSTPVTRCYPPTNKWVVKGRTTFNQVTGVSLSKDASKLVASWSDDHIYLFDMRNVTETANSCGATPVATQLLTTTTCGNSGTTRQRITTADRQFMEAASHLLAATQQQQQHTNNTTFVSPYYVEDDSINEMSDGWAGQGTAEVDRSGESWSGSARDTSVVVSPTMNVLLLHAGQPRGRNARRRRRGETTQTQQIYQRDQTNGNYATNTTTTAALGGRATTTYMTGTAGTSSTTGTAGTSSTTATGGGPTGSTASLPSAIKSTDIHNVSSECCPSAMTPPYCSQQPTTAASSSSSSPSVSPPESLWSAGNCITTGRQQWATISSSSSESESEWEPKQRPLLPIRSYSGHRNMETVKDVQFIGPGEEYVASGSDDGRLFIWETLSGKLAFVGHRADADVLNCVVGHPRDPVVVCSGIDHDIKVWRPIASSRQNCESEEIKDIVEENREYRQAMPLTVEELVASLRSTMRSPDSWPSGFQVATSFRPYGSSSSSDGDDDDVIAVDPPEDDDDDTDS
eukprot:GHVS01079006.1.p1 GENE.GHVS01079006.1~~GHVS01079006.1.p1  ORF type:complete len:801 (+),score=174.67 GHVS01079006.1:156-2405(+)